MSTPVHVDERSRRRRLTPVIATGIAALVATMYVRAVDPNVPGYFPGCPSRMILGVDCPGCGGMRGTYDLLHGDVAGMLDDNVLLIIALPAAVISFLIWGARAWTGIRPPVDTRRHARYTRASIVVLIVVVVFGVIRNFVPYLGSGPG
ncbi:MAG: DUF2752 domain-containing protein [Candidatus Nanopelagicales bacterium]